MPDGMIYVCLIAFMCVFITSAQGQFERSDVFNDLGPHGPTFGAVCPFANCSVAYIRENLEPALVCDYRPGNVLVSLTNLISMFSYLFYLAILIYCRVYCIFRMQ